jgi:hypothetical protein
MSVRISGPPAESEALRGDLRPAERASRVLAHPDHGPAAAAEQIGGRR